MAEGIVTNLANDLHNTLISLQTMPTPTCLPKKLQRKFTEMLEKVNDINKAIPDAEVNQSSSLKVRVWLEKLEFSLLEADDLVEEEEVSYHDQVMSFCDKFIKPDMSLFSDSLRHISRIHQELVKTMEQKPTFDSKLNVDLARRTTSQLPIEVVPRIGETEVIIGLLQVPSSSSSLDPVAVGGIMIGLSSSLDPVVNDNVSTNSTQTTARNISSTMVNLSSVISSQPHLITSNHSIENVPSSSNSVATIDNNLSNISCSQPCSNEDNTSTSISPSQPCSNEDNSSTSISPSQPCSNEDNSSTTISPSTPCSDEDNISTTISPSTPSIDVDNTSNTISPSHSGESRTRFWGCARNVISLFLCFISLFTDKICKFGLKWGCSSTVGNTLYSPLPSQPGSDEDNTSTTISPPQPCSHEDNTSTTISPPQPCSDEDNTSTTISPSQLHSNEDNTSNTISPSSSQPCSNEDNLSSTITSSQSIGTQSHTIIVIVGLLGSGKTTLSQLVFGDARVEQHFGLKLWVCISGLLSYDEIMTEIIKSANLDFHLELVELIKGKRCLLVLDDLCTDDHTLWDALKALIDNAARGSKVLVNTRKHVFTQNIEGYATTYKLGRLCDDDGWSLFCKLVTEVREQERIGKGIVAWCKNSPLVLRLVANVIAQGESSSWLHSNIDMTDIFTPQNNHEVLNALRPSYNQLNSHLKHCFAYCSLFPKDFKFREHSLTQLWMAQGFLKPEKNFSLEEIGKSQFQHLVGMSLLTSDNEPGNAIMSYRLNNLFRHLAKNVAGARCTAASYSGSTILDERTIHVSIEFDGSFPKALFRVHKLRTLICFKKSTHVKLSKWHCEIICSRFKRLRALNISNCGLDILPNNIANLIHLRYLDLSGNESLLRLPNSITQLRNLLTLNLNFCHKLEALPQSIGRLAKLRHLEIEECDSLTHMPLGLDKLVSLQTLNRFVVRGVSKDSGGIKVLNGLNNLKGRLKIDLSGQWTEVVQDARVANLERKKNLTDLKIEWRVGVQDDTPSCHYYEAFLEGLFPPPNLNALSIEGYRGRDFPSWARKDTLCKWIQNLETISIEGCRECKHLPLFGRLERLRCLKLRNMERVQYVIDETYDPGVTPAHRSFYGSLEELTLDSFYSLEGWWRHRNVTEKDGMPCFPKLLKLRIWHCPKLKSLPLFNAVEEVDLKNVNQILLEVSSVSVEVREDSGTASDDCASLHATLTALSYVPSSGALSHGLLQNLMNLKHLYIKALPHMQIFPKVWDQSIQSLVIDKCEALTSVAQGLRLTSLEMLEISHCNKLNFWAQDNTFPWTSLVSLRRLIFAGISNMGCLPIGVKEINSLTSLQIMRCSDLTSLPEWIGDMSSLKHLRIEACRKLTSLPECRSCLGHLEKLEIMECPQLMERCREGGEDRPKINRDAKVLLHKSWRYGLMNDADRAATTAEAAAKHSKFSIQNTTMTLKKNDAGNSWSEITYKSSLKAAD